ncbi:4-hydroxythreonine-4-phosphate dehydrogenase PdxA [Cohaesibacter celericrescens]|uniref:4-hydroxythreonine-4-phosphate dehydrogenase n=1 Tax=Cohaesibacter celericrescens TaxID=2067669 RepID=A0A2N5XSH8_9HYPH|nr:4-hydroxythreonine-4-phosphate dehydrogenase PdxA [Cohaesibacter celericrescens]PLW77397.1 4-hydroxythreonine-4-phosphate dehydrogenase PdxA [Cohaesibacter celericrescens]
MPSKSDIIALSMGEPAGIGPEIVLKAWLASEKEGISPFAVFGDPELLASRARMFGLSVPIRVCTLEEAFDAFPMTLPVIPLENAMTDNPGVLEVSNAAGVIEAIEKATAAVLSGDAKAVVTCPIQKSNVYKAGFKHPGHTEYLGYLVEKMTGKKANPVMMLAGPELRTVPVTAHMPISKVSEALTKERIEEVALIAAHDLKMRFGIANPRIAVAGLNPHAGEEGAMGTEDAEIIAPVVKKLRDAGHRISGPYPGDTLYHKKARETYDAALAMYHDQALIPVKTIGFDETVNVTLGLPFIRTSPDHGTAIDIAEKGIANPSSLIAALKLASSLKS